MNVVAHVPQYLLFKTTLPFSSFLLARVSECRFFTSHVVASIVGFDSRKRTQKYDTIRPRYEDFNASGGSCPSLPCLWHKITFSFISLSWSFEIWIFSSYVVAYIVRFDSSPWSRKSDIIRPRYQLFNACGGSYPSLPCLWHYLTFLFIALSPTFGI